MRDKIYIKIHGLNLSRIIDKLVSKNVFIDNVKIKNKTLKFAIQKNDIYVLDEVCKREHKFYEIISRSGFVQMFFNLKFYIGFVLAVVIIFCYLYSFNGLIFKVDIMQEFGLNIDYENITKKLSDNGIKKGMKKSEVSIGEIQKIILENCGDLAGCSVIQKGGELVIHIFPEIKNNNDSSDIISKFDAVVSRVDLHVGKLNVSVGDIVRTGDVLVINDDGAKADVFGKVYCTATIIYDENQEVAIKTGKSVVDKVYRINDLILFKHVKNKVFSKYLTKKCSFYICENYFLPIICEEVLYEEVEIEKKIIPFEDVKEKVKDNVHNEAMKKVKDDFEVLGETFSIVQEGRYTRVDCFIECEVKIA